MSTVRALANYLVVGIGYVVLAASALCLQIYHFFLTTPRGKFLTVVAEKSVTALLLPYIFLGVLFALAGYFILRWPGRNPRLRKPIRRVGGAISGVWLLLCLDFVGVARILPEGILPQAQTKEWIASGEVTFFRLWQDYWRMFKPGVPRAPVAQYIPWILAICAFIGVAFLVTRQTRGTRDVGRAKPYGDSLPLSASAEGEVRGDESSEGLSLSPWTCSRCGEDIDKIFDSCWKCGNVREKR
jgi:hypothetical protein